MEEPKALLPNGHSDSLSDDKPQQMEVDEVEPKMKDDVKTEPKRTKSTDAPASDEASDSTAKIKTNESEETIEESSENTEKQIEKSASKKKVPQKIVKRSPRISRNKDPPGKDDSETRRSKSEDKEVERKSDDKLSKMASTEEEKGSKEAGEVKKEEKTDEVAAVSEESKAETGTIKEVEKKDKGDNKTSGGEIRFTGDPEADFLGFDDLAESNYSSRRDSLKKMLDELITSMPGHSRSRRSVTKRDKAKDEAKARDDDKAEPSKASATESVAVKKEAELESEAWFDRKMQESQPSQLSYYDGSGDGGDDDIDHEGSGVSNAMLIPEVVYMTGVGGSGPRSSAKDDSRSRRSRPSLVGQTDRKPSPVIKRNYDVTLPQYLKPFEYGWKRELAYRNNTDTISKRNADVFYYTPLGKKIRSIGQVRDYLLGTDLTLENFTFVTKSMNLGDPNKETIRDPRKKVVEKVAAVVVDTSPLTTRKSSAASKTQKPANSVESTAADKAEEKSSTSPPKAAASPIPTPKISLKSFRPPPKTKVADKKAKKVSDESENEKEELEMGMLPPLWKSPIRSSDWSANGSTTMDISSATKSGGGGGVVVRSGQGEGKVEVCSIRCPLMIGEIPTLACVVCLCLHHPECVGVHRNILNYVCQNCQDTNKPKTSALTPIHSSPPPLVPINSSQPDSNQSESFSSAAPQLQRLLDSKAPKKPQPKIVGGVTTWLPPSSMIQLTSKSTTTSKMSSTAQVATVESSSVNALPAQTLWQMNGKRFLYVPKHNVLSVSPAATTSTSDTQNQTAVNTLAATTQSGNSVLVSSGCVSMPPLIQNAVPSSFLASIGGNFSNPALIVSDSNIPNSSSSPAGVLLVPCITTSSTSAGPLSSGSSDNTTQKFLLVNGPTGPLPVGNFLIGNLPPQQQPHLPTLPTTQPAVPSNESEKGSKRQLEPAESEPPTSPPAKRAKKDTGDVEPIPADPAPPATPAPDAPKTAEPAPAPPDVSVPSVVSVPQPPPSSSVSVNKDFFMTNVSAIYHALLNSFQYLKVQELLRAARVCHMWRDVAMNRSLWHIVRMKNSRVRDWDGLANTLRNTGARHLDMRKMLMPDKSEDVTEMWSRYAQAIDRVNSLWRIDLCRCPASAIERSARANARLQYLSALAIKSSSLDSSAFENCKNLTELRLKSSEKNGLDLENLSSLKHLAKMKHLSLTTMKSFSGGLAEALENMKDLETLELGECSELTESVAKKALPKLKRLQRLRLEKGQGPDCPTIAILESVKDLKNLVQLELINFDIKSGFDTTISKCTNLRTLLIIPTYVTQSATTNHLVMEGVSKLSKTLTLFVWGITLELLRVTDLFIDQWEGQKGAIKSPSNSQKKGSGDSIPILKPLAEAGNKEGGAPSQVDILQLPKLHKVLTSLLPTTKVKILKVPFSATWRQTVSGPAHIH